jgi:hypothetical protein
MVGVTSAAVCFLAAAAAYAGFQWTVHIVVYRQFAAVPADAFPTYVRLHQRRISFVVGPLFAALLLSVGWLVAARPVGVPLWLALVAAGLVLVILAVTALGAVPLHRTLSARWDGAAYRSLLRVDFTRTIAATAMVFCGLGIAILSLPSIAP